MILYHATYRANLKSIKELGLGARQKKNWSFSESGVVCFATDADVAYSYAETADEVSDFKYNSGIIVLAVDSSRLDVRYAGYDQNIKDEESQCYAYRGIVNPMDLYVVTSDSGIVGRLLQMKKVPAYE